jgi:predicted alpha/beta-hydrolase family hydrolase
MMIDSPTNPSATLVLAHGAGAGMDTPFMNDFAKALFQHGIEVVRFEFPYMAKLRAEGKRSAPDRMPELEAAYRDVVGKLKKRARLFIGGKSMGGRVATRIADSVGVRGVIALGYPFHPPKQPESLRVEHLISMTTPCLIVQGTRDPFGTHDEVPRYALPASIQLHWLRDGDHSFVPRKSSGRSEAENMSEAYEAVLAFLAQH